MERTYTLVEIEEKKLTRLENFKKFSKVFLTEALYAGLSIAFFYAVNRVYNYYTEDDRTKEENSALLLITCIGLGFAALTSLCCVGGIYKSRKIMTYQSAILGENSNELLSVIKEKSAMFYAVKKYYEGKIGMDAIEAVYQSRAFKPIALRNDSIQKALDTIKKDNLNEYGQDLGIKYITFKKKVLEADVVRQFRKEFLNPYKFDNWLIPNILVSIVSNIKATSALRIVEGVIKTIKNTRSQDDYKFKKLVERTLGKTRVDYEEEIQDLIGINFKECYFDEDYSFIDYKEILDFYGQTINVQLGCLERDKEKLPKNYIEIDETTSLLSRFKRSIDNA